MEAARSKGTKRWAIGDDDAKTAAALRAFDFLNDDWRPGDRVPCAFGYWLGLGADVQ